MQDETKQSVQQVWREAGLYATNDPKLQRFLQHFEQTLHACWPNLVPLVRESYAEYEEQLMIPIWDTGHKMLRLAIILAVAPDHSDEVQIFQRLAQRPNRGGSASELDALMRIARRRGLISA